MARAETEEALIQALRRIIENDGPSAVGINAIAREAKVNKALIYRYFKNLDGLYLAFAQSTTIWPSMEEILGDIPDRKLPWREALVDLLVGYAQAIRSRPLTLKLLAWECTERNALTIAFEDVREKRSLEISAAMANAGFEPDVDIHPAVALIASAIHYLAIRGQEIKVFGDVNIGAESFWETELRTTLEMMFRGFGKA